MQAVSSRRTQGKTTMKKPPRLATYVRGDNSLKRADNSIEGYFNFHKFQILISVPSYKTSLLFGKSQSKSLIYIYRPTNGISLVVYILHHDCFDINLLDQDNFNIKFTIPTELFSCTFMSSVVLYFILK